MPPISIGTPLGAGCSTCGYCRPSGQRSSAETSVKKAGLIAVQLSCADDRSRVEEIRDILLRPRPPSFVLPAVHDQVCGTLLLKDIQGLFNRLDALAFKPSRSQRKLLNRWNRFVRDDGNADAAPDQPKRKCSQAVTFCLSSSIHSSERAFFPVGEEPRHDFQVTLERSSYTDEKYALYVAYQTQVHRDDDNTPGSFKRFLVQSPLVSELIPYEAPPPSHLPSHFGSYHQLYRLDGELIAVGVLDILPGCVSSVYFMYNAKWEKYSLGKLSALREAALAREIHDAGPSSLNALYMGFYIHSCSKMKYKGDYAPSFLADPEDFTWHPLEDCLKLLDRYRYATFSQPSHSLAGSDDPGEIFEADNEEELARDARSIYSIQNNTVSLIPVTMSQGWEEDYSREEVVGCIRALGAELSREIIFRM